jgi:hypothetical protein
MVRLRICFISFSKYTDFMYVMLRSVFKTRAGKIEKGLKSAGFSVTMNPTKPRKGAFVITEEGNETPFVELLNLARPFTKLRELDVDEVVAQIVNA